MSSTKSNLPRRRRDRNKSSQQESEMVHNHDHSGGACEERVGWPDLLSVLWVEFSGEGMKECWIVGSALARLAY